MRGGANLDPPCHCPCPLLALELTKMIAMRAAEARCRWAAGATLPKGEESPQPPGMGGVAPLVERFEATPPLRRPDLVLCWDECIEIMRVQKPALPEPFPASGWTPRRYGIQLSFEYG